MGDGIESGRRREVFWARRIGAGVAAGALLIVVAGCGGRPANPTATNSALDARLNCAHLAAEKEANLRRLEDLDDERDANRVRSLTRLPGALIGNPLSAIVLADPSIAIYQEEAALEKRNARIDALIAEKTCDAKPADVRVAAVTPLDETVADDVAPQIEEGEEVDEALAAPQPEIAPTILRDDEEAEVVAETVVEAEERDAAAQEALDADEGETVVVEDSALEPAR